MSDSLTTLITKIQALLGDDGTIFSTATITAAVRQALSEWNLRATVAAATTITGVNDQYEYELSDYDSSALDIIDILKQGPSNNERDISLTYDEYVEDERVFFRLREPVTSSDTLIVRYTLEQTIDGLDGATETTVANRYNQAMIDGGAFFSVFIRAMSRIENNNLDKEVIARYQGMASVYGSSFVTRIAQASKRKPPVGEPDSRTWAEGEKYNSWDT